MAIINFYKPLGWTPLECIEEIRRIHPEWNNDPITYTGRLDPMAEGVIVFLTGEDRHQKENFQNLDKTYHATFLFGLSSDTYDALGIIQKGSDPTRDQIEQELTSLPGKHSLPFPPYSSFKVQGKPLHWWAQQHRLQEIHIPHKEMRVNHSHVEIVSSERLENIRSEVFSRIDRVTGNFRQAESKDSWENLGDSDQNYWISVVTLDVQSGTYIRALAHRLGNQLGCGAILLSLKRGSVGPYLENDSEYKESYQQPSPQL